MKYMFKFPDIGEGLEEGKIIEWYVEKGQSILSGDPLVKMETDKVVTDIPSPKSGIISQRFGGIGETVKVGSALVEIDMPGVEGAAAQAEAQQEIKAPSAEVVEEKGFGVVGTIEVAGDGAYLPSSGEGMEAAVTAIEEKPRKVLATPVARAMAKERGIDINEVTGTGPANRVTIKDIDNYKPTSTSAKPVTANITSEMRTEAVPLSMIRKTIAKNMLRSKQNAAHMSVMDEVEVSALVKARSMLKARLEKDGIRLSYLPFVIKAISIALKHYPILNAELDLEAEKIIYKHYINMGIAVDTDDGLVVPVIKDADKKSLVQLAKELNEISAKAQERKLTMQDLKDGTFSITSYGSIGGYFAVPVINYPQVAIFGIGKLVEKPVVKDGAVVVGKILPISMSVDHRIVDGGVVARFLNEVLEYLKEPLLMLAMEGGSHEL
ncbi:MAG: 2-oxo acid dehydrogenase subunit E2 [Candidatus Cloacimonetes bacterium]|nr:2-oxo acid dehydrogenase subunit E2 [Candidatus Cloacimonadota bacterium]